MEARVGTRIGNFVIEKELKPKMKRNHILYRNFLCKCVKCTGYRILGEYKLQYAAITDCEACDHGLREAIENGL